jgi:hypothetical protein
LQQYIASAACHRDGPLGSPAGMSGLLHQEGLDLFDDGRRVEDNQAQRSLR